ncbi:GNAT family N-acetyltransferase [Streptococcus suis]|nr:GNAT family N-acetyltransferase [Streptococcus suis]
MEEEHTVGLVRTTVAEDAEQGWLGLIGIDPDYRGKGYGHKAMLELESLYPTVKRWVLCTVLQEPRLVAFYESLGYKAIKTEPEQEGMDMVYMEKWIG